MFFQEKIQEHISPKISWPLGPSIYSMNQGKEEPARPMYSPRKRRWSVFFYLALQLYELQRLVLFLENGTNSFILFLFQNIIRGFEFFLYIRLTTNLDIHYIYKHNVKKRLKCLVIGCRNKVTYGTAYMQQYKSSFRKQVRKEKKTFLISSGRKFES